jgi:hypothetical protein
MAPRMLVALMAATALCGCSGTGPTGPRPTTGTLVGYAYLLPNCGFATTHEGVLVTVEGTSRSTSSDTTGRWEFADLPPGTYVLAFTKPGYGAYKASLPVLIGRVTVDSGYIMHAIPTGGTSNMRVGYTTGHDGITIGWEISSETCLPDCWDPSVLVVIGSDLSVLSPSNYAVSIETDACAVTYTTYLNNHPRYVSGEKVYVKTYIVAYGGWYYDPTVNRTIYTAVSPSSAPVDSIVVP